MSKRVRVYKVLWEKISLLTEKINYDGEKNIISESHMIYDGVEMPTFVSRSKSQKTKDYKKEEVIRAGFLKLEARKEAQRSSESHRL